MSTDPPSADADSEASELATSPPHESEETVEASLSRDPHVLSEIDLEESVDLEDLMHAFVDAPPPPRSTQDAPPNEPLEEGASVVREHLKGLLEALVFASDKPQRTSDLAKIATADVREVRELLSTLRKEYAHRGIQLDEVAGGWIFRTSPAYAPFVRESTGKKPVRLARAQLETLAILAYRQPVTRPEIDDIRGVDSGGALKALLERDLVRILGRKDEPGRPVLYGTSNRFLELFQMKSLRDLPALREFTELTEESLRMAEEELADAATEQPDEPKLPREAYEDPAPDGHSD